MLTPRLLFLDHFLKRVFHINSASRSKYDNEILRDFLDFLCNPCVFRLYSLIYIHVYTRDKHLKQTNSEVPIEFV